MTSYTLTIKTINPQTTEGSRAQEAAIAEARSPRVAETKVVEVVAPGKDLQSRLLRWVAANRPQGDELISYGRADDGVDNGTGISTSSDRA